MLEVVNAEKRVISLYEICKIMGKEHRKAIRLAEEIQSHNGFGRVEKITTLAHNQTIETYSYTEKQALMIGARLDSSNIIVLVNKLEELSKPKKLTTAEILQLSSEEILRLEDKVEVLTNDNKFLSDNLTSVNSTIKEITTFNEDGYSIASWANVLMDRDNIDIGRNGLFKLLREMGYLYREGTHNLPYKKWRDQDLFEVKMTEHVKNGKQRVDPQTRITFKGMMKLHEKVKDEYINRMLK